MTNQNQFQSNARRDPFAEAITPKNSACILIDHQVGLFTLMTSAEPSILLNNILGLAKTVKALEIPTILTTSWAAGMNGPTIPELTEIFPDEPIIERNTVNFWDHPESVAALEKLNRKKLIIAAFDTTTCLALSAVYGVQRGYDVYAVIDASATTNHQIELAAMMRMTLAGAVVTSWAALLAELAADTAKNGKHIANLLSQHESSYANAWRNFVATGKNADAVVQAVGADT